MIGVGEAFSRRPRALLAIFALALSIAALMAALGMESAYATASRPSPCGSS